MLLFCSTATHTHSHSERERERNLSNKPKYEVVKKNGEKPFVDGQTIEKKGRVGKTKKKTTMNSHTVAYSLMSRCKFS